MGSGGGAVGGGGSVGWGGGSVGAGGGCVAGGLVGLGLSPSSLSLVGVGDGAEGAPVLMGRRVGVMVIVGVGVAIGVGVKGSSAQCPGPISPVL